MSESVDSIFDQLVADCDVQVQTMPFNDKQLLIDGSAGDEFRTELFRIQSGILPMEGELDNAAIARLDAAVEQAVIRGGLGIDLGSYVAVTGRGIYLTAEGDGEQRADLVMLYPGQILVGELAGVSFNRYPYAPGLESLPLNHNGVIIPKDDREGLLMSIGSAMLCSIEDDGQLENWYDFVLVPLPEHTLQVQAAEIVG